jgi:hypothetical protein
MRTASHYFLQIMQTMANQALRFLTQMQMSDNRAQHLY